MDELWMRSVATVYDGKIEDFKRLADTAECMARQRGSQPGPLTGRHPEPGQLGGKASDRLALMATIRGGLHACGLSPPDPRYRHTTSGHVMLAVTSHGG
jgi:hypothetical protein